MLAVLPNGSCLTRFQDLRVRAIDADITLTTSSGQRITGRFRRATTPLDHRHDPAEALARLSDERWETRSAFYPLRHTLLTGRVLRSQNPRGLEQEVWALLTVYQTQRMAMVDAIKSLPGADPDRASLTVALQAARDQLVCADHALSDPSDCTVSGIATAVPSALLPSRRSRTSARKVKCPTSRYPAHPTSERPLTSQNIIGLAIEIQTQLPASATHSHSGQRNQVLQLMRTEPHRPWHARELATALAYAQHGSFCVQLGRWAREGLLDRTADATYRLAPDCLPPEASPTDSQCP